MDLKLVVYLSSYFMLLVESVKRDKFLLCSVCRALVDEADLIISKIDPQKTTEVGSFRIDSHGNQVRTQIKYSRSESQLTEMMETVCETTAEYNRKTDEQGRVSVIRTTGKDGKNLDVTKMEFDLFFTQKIKTYCDGILEDHEEEIINLFKSDDVSLPDLTTSVCSDLLGACTDEWLSVPLPVGEGFAEEEEEEEDDDDEEEDVKKEVTVEENKKKTKKDKFDPKELKNNTFEENMKLVMDNLEKSKEEL